VFSKGSKFHVNFLFGRARLAHEREDKQDTPAMCRRATGEHGRGGGTQLENNRQGVDHMKRIVLGLLAAAAISVSAFAADVKPAIIYDLGGKFDKSFNEAAYNGAEKFKSETGIAYRDFEIQNDAQREQALRKFAEDGNNPIVMAGFSWAAALEKVATEFPDLQFAIIDMVVDKPNIRSVVYKEHEGSYVVGVMAAMASKSKKVGFVGGMDIPLIRKFGCGYVGGAKAAGATDVIQNMTGDTPAAWNDPTKGGEIAKSQIDQGADVVYAAAGGTGVGVLQAAADAGKLGIGVDSNQNGLQPGKILTSMVKRVDVAVYNAFKDAQDSKFTAGINNLGLKEDGVGYAMDENNKDLVTPEMAAAAEKAKADIIAGTIQVHDYMSDNACPY
jgi:basic membrane protein A